MQNDHQRLDERSLAIHMVVAEKLRTDPALLNRARGNLTRWRATLSGAWMDEWQAVLDGPLERLLSFLGDRSERATRLRQSSPFAGVLTQQERRAIYESYPARTHHPGG